jgi:glucose-6-phosphate isomerase
LTLFREHVMPLRLDFTNMMAGPLPHGAGLTAAQWAEGASHFASAHSAVMARHAAGTLGFIDLPGDHATRDALLAAAHAHKGAITDVLLLGIGGSALGPIALRSALRRPHWNELDTTRRDGWPRLHVLDNVDPVTIDATLERLPLTSTLVLVISKSGGTVETMAQYLIVRAALEAAVGVEHARARMIFVTDPAVGALRAVARAEGITTFDIPANVGGRFSVLSPVGLLPAALIGIDIAGVLEGAAAMAARCATPVLADNPAGVFATLQWLADSRHGAHVHVLMPYADALRDIAAWFVQLWAESLGKIRPDGTSVGPTPLPALGATDQHAQVQLFMEGPADKTVMFLAVAGKESLGPIPARHAERPELGYLGGHTLGRLLDIERQATAGALAARGRLNATITLPAVDAPSVGALLYLLELATAYAGELYAVNAFDQPGVELGKQFAYAMLGRAGSEAARAEWDALPHPDPRHQV